MKNQNKLKIIPLGGIKEIGKNITVIEYRDDIIIVDCGLTFPEDEMLGIDIVIPDFQYLVENRRKIRGLVLTHGHEDHIGAVPYVLKQINMPIYGTKLTLGLLENKLKEHKISRDNLNVVKHGDTIKLGKMEVEFIKTSHSIPDSSALAIKTPLGNIIHTGDFKVDLTPINSDAIDLNKFAEYGDKGVLLLMSDSTNATRPGYTMSESKVGETFNDLFGKYSGSRIIIATFASNVHRIQQIIYAAEKYDRKVVLSGRSMINVTTVASELGYLDVKKGTIIDIRNMKKYKDEELVLITTGSQGEPLSALTRIAYGEHKRIHLHPSDVVILSANPIPGNEKSVTKVINKLMEKEVEVIYQTLSEIHVSGHACQEELKLIMSLTKPKYFMPVHGETMHILEHASLARDMGIEDENIIMIENGDCLEISRRGLSMGEPVTSGNILVDGLGIGDVGNIVLRDRKHLSEDGLIAVVVTLDQKTKKMIAGPDIITRGFVYVRESGDLIEEARNVVKDILLRCEKEGIKDWSSLKNNIRDGLKSYLFSEIKRNPMIIPIIMEV
ncbi:MAG: ribonuclease J [Tissierellia bacterium]|nr:ribonuclease J [Tissierellia bacterium]